MPFLTCPLAISSCCKLMASMCANFKLLVFKNSHRRKGEKFPNTRLHKTLPTYGEAPIKKNLVHSFFLRTL